jgi:hypothetical protein
MAFVNTNIPSVQGAQNFETPPVLAGAVQQNIFIYGNMLSTTSPTGLPIITPNAGYPRYEYYKTYQVPSQYLNNGISLLGYFENCGFNVGFGYTSSISLLNASAVDSTSLASANQVKVYYLNSAELISPLVNSSITGTFDDTTATVTGTFVEAAVGSFTYLSVVYDSYVILESTSFASVVAGNNITIAFDNPLLTPNPSLTDEFLMNLYYAAQATLIPVNINSTVATPNIYFAILPDAAHSGLFGPTTSPLTLAIPTAASGSTITFSAIANNVGYIPLSELGATTITQATSNATGTIESAQINGGSIIVTLSNISGTFNTTNVCTLNLDATQTIMSFQKEYFAANNISLRYFAYNGAVNEASDISTTMEPLTSYIAELNEPATSQNGQAICHVVFSNISISKNVAAVTLPTNVNNWQYIPVWYNYNKIKIGDLPLSASNVSSGVATVLASNVSPNNPQAGVIINGMPVLADKSNYVGTSIGGTADTVQGLGWNVIGVNNNLQAYMINPVTGLTTLPNTPTTNKEFRPTYVYDTLNQLRLGIINICQSLGLGQIRQTPKVISNLKGNIVSFMLEMQQSGQLLNVLINEKYIVIKQDPTNPLGIDITIPAQIIPGLEQVNYTINVFSSTITLS